MSEPYYADEAVTLHHGNCLDVLRTLPDASVDAVVTDPPYGLGFMGREWDDLPPGLPFAQECLRVLKPGGHLVAFGGSRTWHRLAVAVEDAGFEIRDSIAWLYGSGFPKSLDVSKAIDRQRDDRDDILRVTAFMADHAEAHGITRADVDARMGTSDMGGWWLSRLRHRCQVPKWDQWLALKEILSLPNEMDAEVWRLNGRKGTPGEAWDQREVVGERTTGLGTGRGAVAYIGDSDNRDITAPATEAAQQWQGWGTALKPAFEPIVVGRKPFPGTVAANVLQHGTGALNIDGCRVGSEERTYAVTGTPGANGVRLSGGDGRDAENARRYAAESKQRPPVTVSGRWPTNVVLDESQAVALDKQSGFSKSPPIGSVANKQPRIGQVAKGDEVARVSPNGHGDSGGASRFFPVFRYEAKAPTSERPTYERDGEAQLFAGSIRKRCTRCSKQEVNVGNSACTCDEPDFQPDPAMLGKVTHPTVKPLDLMRWLVRLVTPPGGTVLEPFAGSGTTAEACVIEGFQCIAIEREADYLPLIVARLTKPIQIGLDFGGVA